MFEKPPPEDQEPADKKLKVDTASEEASTPVEGVKPKQAGKPTTDMLGNALVPPPLVAKVPRPPAPKMQPPGIPEGQPLPPTGDPDGSKKAPAPVRPLPEKGRHAPTSDPKIVKEKFVAPDPPQDPPPYQKGVKVQVKEEVFVPRREREDPEFESSSDEEDKDFPSVKPKGYIPASINKLARIGAAAAQAEAEAPTKSAEELEAEEALKAEKGAQLAEKQAEEDARFGVKKEDDDDSSAKQKRVVPDKPKKPEIPDYETKNVDSAAGISVAETLDSVSDIASQVNVGADLPPTASAPENIVSTYVPPPPSTFDIAPVVEELSKEINGGRLLVKCVQGKGIKRKSDPNKIPRIDAYMKFKLGAAERFPWVSTAVKRKQDNNPVFDDEIVSFDVINPADYIFGGDFQLSIELYHKSSLKDELLGTCIMSVTRFFKTPYVVFAESMPFLGPGEKTTNQLVDLEFSFEEARTGMFAVTLYEARGLRQIDPLGQQDPYTQLSLGNRYKKKSKVVKGGGVEPYFAEEEVLMWVDKENWVNDLRIDLYDEHIGDEKVIGFTHFSLLPYMDMKPNEARDEAFDLFYEYLKDPKDDKSKVEVTSGEIVMKITYYPAGHLTMQVNKGKGLAFPESYTPPPGSEKRIDPYVSLTLEGQAVKMVKKTPVDKDGGADPSWDYEIDADIVDQYMVDVEVFHQSVNGSDVSLGFAQMSLLPVFRAGKHSSWCILKQKKLNGGIKEVGTVNIASTFYAGPQLAYPLYRPNVDSFDDSVRKLPDAKKAVDVDEEKDLPTEIITDPSHYKKDQYGRAIEDEAAIKQREHEEKKADDQRSGAFLEDDGEEKAEFSHEEIVAAFKFIDLDHNNYVGASEIRHILVCMGEMITDEEIDTMISMVDTDGDGQVSFEEFRTLVLHPNPGGANLHEEVQQSRENDKQKEKQALAGKPVGLDLTSFQRQKEMILRETKKRSILAFIDDNELDFDGVRHGYESFLSISADKRVRGRIKFDQFCYCLRVEPISEYKKLFSLYDNESLGDIDFREFLLSVTNFVEVEKEVRIRFSFQMYDELKSGFISQREIEEILKGNHMIGLSSVQRKADTIMKQAVRDKSGSITLNEFLVVSRKFPNILLPNLDNGDGKNKG